MIVLQGLAKAHGYDVRKIARALQQEEASLSLVAEFPNQNPVILAGIAAIESQET